MKKSAAFSLIEAMIILMLISVAVMALIPLVTKQSTPLGWKARMATDGTIDYLYFGDKSNNKVGIGQNVNPYDNNISGKVVTDNAWIGNTREIFRANMLGGDVCSTRTANNNGIFIRSQAHTGNPVDCTADNIQINNNTDAAGAPQHHSDFSWVPDGGANDNLSIYSVNNQPVISVTTGADGANTFSINSPNDINILSYNGTTLSTVDDNVNNTVKIGNGGNGTLTFGLEQLDRINANGSVDTTKTVDRDIVYQFQGYDGDNKRKCVEVSDTTSNIADKNSGGNTDEVGTYYWTYNDCMNSILITIYSNTISSKTFTCKENENIQYGPTHTIQNKSDPGPHCTKMMSEDTTVGFRVSSDKRLKNVLSTYKKGINEIGKIKTYNFTYKNDKKQQLNVGLIAQKIQGIFDEALHKDSKGYFSYDKTPILYAMVNAVKDIFNVQYKTAVKQKKLNKKADKLLKKYEKRNG